GCPTKRWFASPDSAVGKRLDAWLVKTGELGTVQKHLLERWTNAAARRRGPPVTVRGRHASLLARLLQEQAQAAEILLVRLAGDADHRGAVAAELHRPPAALSAAPVALVAVFGFPLAVGPRHDRDGQAAHPQARLYRHRAHRVALLGHHLPDARQLGAALLTERLLPAVAEDRADCPHHVVGPELPEA